MKMIKTENMNINTENMKKDKDEKYEKDKDGKYEKDKDGKYEKPKYSHQNDDDRKNTTITHHQKREKMKKMIKDYPQRKQTKSILTKKSFPQRNLVVLIPKLLRIRTMICR